MQTSFPEMDEAISRSWASYQQPDSHGHRRSLSDSGDWSLVGMGVLVLVLQIVGTIIVIALLVSVVVMFYLIKMWCGNMKWPWTRNKDTHHLSAGSDKLLETLVQVVSVGNNVPPLRPLQGEDDQLPGLQNEWLCPGERCPSFGPRTDKKVTPPFSTLRALSHPDDVEMEYYNFDNVSWFANHLDYNEEVASVYVDSRIDAKFRPQFERFFKHLNYNQEAASAGDDSGTDSKSTLQFETPTCHWNSWNVHKITLEEQGTSKKENIAEFWMDRAE